MPHCLPGRSEGVSHHQERDLCPVDRPSVGGTISVATDGRGSAPSVVWGRQFPRLEFADGAAETERDQLHAVRPVDSWLFARPFNGTAACDHDVLAACQGPQAATARALKQPANLPADVAASSCGSPCQLITRVDSTSSGAETRSRCIKVAPACVPSRHFDDQPHDLVRSARPTRPAPRTAVVFPGDQFPIPTLDRVGRCDRRQLRQGLPTQLLAENGQFLRSVSVNRIRFFPSRSSRARFTVFRYSIWSAWHRATHTPTNAARNRNGSGRVFPPVVVSRPTSRFVRWSISFVKPFVDRQNRLDCSLVFVDRISLAVVHSAASKFSLGFSFAAPAR